MIDIEINFDGLEKLPMWKAATDQQLRLALMRAMNKTARWFRTRALRSISRELKVPQKLLKPRVAIHGSSRNNLEATLWFGIYRIPLFKAARGRSRQTPRGVRALGKVIPRSFLARMPSGHEGIFLRKGKERLPIQEQMIRIDTTVEQNLRKLITGPVRKQFMKIFEHELDYATGSV